MLVLTLLLAAVGFALLVIALMTGSVIWAWGCIAVCVAGAVLLLVSALATRKAAPADRAQAPAADDAADSTGPDDIGGDDNGGSGDSGRNSAQG